MTDIVEEKKGITIDIDKKLTLTPKEASAYSGIGLSTLYRMMENPQYDFVIWIGKKRRIKRTAFEETIQKLSFIDD